MIMSHKRAWARWVQHCAERECPWMPLFSPSASSPVRWERSEVKAQSASGQCLKQPQELSPHGCRTEGALSRGPGRRGQDEDGFCCLDLLFLIFQVRFTAVEIFHHHTGLICHFHQKHYLLQALTWKTKWSNIYCQSNQEVPKLGLICAANRNTLCWKLRSDLLWG